MRSRLIIMLAGLALLAGVGAFSAGATTRARTPAPLVGKWSKTISAGAWRRHHIDYEAPGRFTIAISKAGVITLYGPNAIEVVVLITTMRVVTVGSGSITLSPTADHFCAGKAIFTWRATGKQLTFGAIKDDCDARRVLFTYGPWARVK